MISCEECCHTVVKQNMTMYISGGQNEQSPWQGRTQRGVWGVQTFPHWTSKKLWPNNFRSLSSGK